MSTGLVEYEDASDVLDVEVVQPEKIKVEAKPLTELERIHYQRIASLEKECAECESEANAAKHAAKEAKDRYDASVIQLRSCIEKGPSRQPDLPGMNDDSVEDHDSRLDESIFEVLDLTDRQVEILEGARVETVGDFENIRAGKSKDYPGGLKDLKGVGQKTIDKWEEAVLDWLAGKT